MVSQRRRYALAASCLAAAVALGNAFTNNGEFEGMDESLGICLERVRKIDKACHELKNERGVSAELRCSRV